MTKKKKNEYKKDKTIKIPYGPCPNCENTFGGLQEYHAHREKCDKKKKSKMKEDENRQLQQQQQNAAE